MKHTHLAMAAALAALSAIPSLHAAEFGPGARYGAITPLEFVPTLSSGVDCELRYDFNFNFTIPNNCTFFDAPLQLPEGAYLYGYRVFYIDNSATANLTSYLNTVSWTPDTYSIGTSVSSTGQSTSVSSFFVDVNETVVPQATGYHTVRLTVPSVATGISVRGVRLFWERQISPAPVSASFIDVPTTHPFFREVQALSASSITQGCGGGAFCPDAAVTRGQMAAFLSRALGL